MEQLDRQKKIIEYLRVKPISHGQIYTFQIAIPNPESIEIAPERFEALSSSLTQQNTNLVPLIVRRTDQYSEEEEYEAVYGVDWCLVAKELDVEKLWVWVFDMTDDEAETARQEMEQLMGAVAPPVPDSVKQVELLLKRFDESINRKLDEKLKQQTSNLTKGMQERLEAKLEESLGVILEQLLKTFISPLEREISELKQSIENLTQSGGRSGRGPSPKEQKVVELLNQILDPEIQESVLTKLQSLEIRDPKGKTAQQVIGKLVDAKNKDPNLEFQSLRDIHKKFPSGLIALEKLKKLLD